MARKSRVRYLCTFCEAKINEGSSFCGSCGRPTSWATHDEKVAWELTQYEQERGKLVEAIAAEPLPVIPRTYTRSAHRPEPARTPRPADRSIARTAPPERAPRPAAERKAARRVARPVPLPVQRNVEVDLPDADDAALLFKIVKILNQRITELEQRVEELEGADDHRAVGR